MHLTRAVLFACAALLGTIACSRSGPREAEPVSRVETTGAAGAMEAAHPNEIASRVASQICDRQVRCRADSSLAEPCFRTNFPRARDELATWQCTPGAASARVKDCLATIRSEPCTTDLESRRTLCYGNDKCPDTDATAAPPGRALADAGL